jgi:GT2 family glycosyltransferase
VAWLNDDAEPAPTWLAELEDALDADPGTAAAGAVLTDRDGQVTSAGVRLTDDGHGQDADAPTPGVFGFCGGAALLRTDALHAIGGVPAGFFCYYEDTDTAWRLRLTGWQVQTVTKATATHRHGASSRLGSFRFHRWNERNRLLMLLRCAPAPVAIHLIARFVALTTMLPFRRTEAPNFTVRLRLLVLAEVLLRLPTTLLARWRIGRRATVHRKVIWLTWAGR